MRAARRTRSICSRIRSLRPSSFAWISERTIGRSMNSAITAKQKNVTLLSVVRPPVPTPSAAIAAGAQAFLTGEISEPQAHYARECGVTFLACGHHATERYGAPAVAAHVAAQLGIAHEFVDVDNPA